MPFHPYYTAKDGFGVGIFLLVFSTFLFFAPNALGHPDNYIPANPLSTPAHIVPEWYFLPFYAILKSFTFNFLWVPAKLWGVMAMFGSILLLFVLPWLDTSPVRSGNYRPIFKWFFWALVVDVFVLGWVGQAEATTFHVLIGQVAAIYYFSHFLIVLPIVSAIETPLALPNSISESVLHGEAEESAPFGVAPGPVVQDAHAQAAE